MFSLKHHGTLILEDRLTLNETSDVMMRYDRSRLVSAFLFFSN